MRDIQSFSVEAVLNSLLDFEQAVSEDSFDVKPVDGQ